MDENEGSSESAWQKSDSSRRVNTSGISDRTTGLLRVETFGIPRRFGSTKESDRNLVASSEDIRNQVGVSKGCGDDVALHPFVRTVEWGDVSLRQWLDNPDRTVDEYECVHIFRQIVQIVNVAHSQGVVVHNVRPSCFVMSSFNHVSFIESASCSDSGSDSAEDGSHSQTSLREEEFQLAAAQENTLSEVSCRRSSSVNPKQELLEQAEENKAMNNSAEQVEERKQPFPMKLILAMETNWYTSPEELAGGSSTCASDVYRLGVLLFELFCPSSLQEEKMRTMSSLRHRVLPPQLLLKWSKEASFCLWLLHPDPSSRPKMGELLHSEFLNEPGENLEEREAAMELREKIVEQELLLKFLLLIQQRKQDAADKLQKTVSIIYSDIEEVKKQQSLLKKKGSLGVDQTKDDQNMSENEDSSSLVCRKRYRQGLHFQLPEECNDDGDGAEKSDAHVRCHETILLKGSRLMKNFKKLEAAYFLARCQQSKPPRKSIVEHSPLSSSLSTLSSKEHQSDGGHGGWIHPFLDGLCKYLSYSKLQVKADLQQGDLLNSSNLVCSIAFDRDAEFFATAGVNRKIKVFECDAIMNDTRDIHYPVVEMASPSKLSSLCWNKYIKSQIASSNFEGVVQVWDATRNQVLAEMGEHEKCVWSVDFSSADPTLLASGSDDASVKLWSINQRASIGTIKAKANVCCVQFPSDSRRFLAFGSADHKVYYYDLRNSRAPLCMLNGHSKTVSYVKFVDSTTLVSASTDNTLKLWDLSMLARQINDSPIQSFTGHTNMKNFVGLAVSDGYIATGSETNEVFVYYKALPMPALSFKFINTDPLSGLDMEHSTQFISSVCWRGQSSTLVAANSTGYIKILEMV